MFRIVRNNGVRILPSSSQLYKGICGFLKRSEHKVHIMYWPIQSRIYGKAANAVAHSKIRNLPSTPNAMSEAQYSALAAFDAFTAICNASWGTSE